MDALYSLFLSCNGICTDTRKITKDCLFVCLVGPNFDANTLAQKAIDGGAKAVIIDNPGYSDVVNSHLVPDALKFLQDLAHHHRKQFTLPVIGITGSNGKTTSKELIHAVLSTEKNVLATTGNLNNHIGVPLTLLRIKSSHDIAIIEMGANKFKDIAELCAIAKPTIGIITNIGKAHLEGFKNFEGVLKTKKELFDSIEETKGQIVVNQDDKVLTDILPKEIATLSYSKTKHSDIVGELVKLSPFVEFEFSNESYTSPTLKTNLVGEYNFYNFLAAVTFGKFFKISNQNICRAIEEYQPTNNRSQVTKTPNNTLIVDCYNANPSSMYSALKSFDLVENDKKIAILGDMRELGADEKIEHQKIIEQNQQSGIKTLYVGEVFSALSKELSYTNVESLIEEIKVRPLKGSLILLKGSRSIALEKLLPYL
ncbi:MAG: UDP-N-acetylmuramoyl-tripeptide--D-alanyl-D-alanine ligase [Lentimonas sp.]|jgi:UDP-N-acetylmuramoyl-tripeptide--D-alanyl-D-alanine ligase